MYRITFTDGSPSETVASYEEAIARAWEIVGPDGVVGHDGDLSSFGDRTLFWASSADAQDDDGCFAVGSIIRL